jgi:hypothetical protein
MTGAELVPAARLAQRRLPFVAMVSGLGFGAALLVAAGRRRK